MFHVRFVARLGWVGLGLYLLTQLTVVNFYSTITHESSCYIIRCNGNFCAIKYKFVALPAPEVNSRSKALNKFLLFYLADLFHCSGRLFIANAPRPRDFIKRRDIYPRPLFCCIFLSEDKHRVGAHN